MKRILSLLLIFAVLGTAVAEERKAPSAPPPDAFVEPDSISVGVIQARPDDVGFQALFKTAWEALKQRSDSSGSGFLALVMSFLGTKDADVLLAFLPIQLVRVDRLDKDGHPSPTLGITIAGWPGIQKLYYQSLLVGPDGKPYPTKDVGSTSVVLMKRQPDQPDTEARALASVKGSYANFPNFGVAQRIIPRLIGGSNVTIPDGDLNDVLSTVDRAKDTYGVVLNKNGSLWKYLWWLNQRDCARVQEDVTAERLHPALAHVLFLNWQGDLISDDQMDLVVRFQTDSEEAAEEISEILKLTRGTLKKYGRAGDLQMTTVGRDVLLTVSLVGYKKMLQDYIAGPAAAKGN